MNLQNVKNPVYVSEDGSRIDCIITVEGIGDLPFTASSSDVEAHGRQIHAAIIAGNYGPIAPYVPPPPPPQSKTPKTTGTQTV